MRTRNSLLSLLAAVVLTSVLGVGPTQAASDLEYGVKAVYLVRFAAFVGWPAGAFAPGEPVGICVVGQDPFGARLDNAASGQTAHGRSLAVHRVVSADGLRGCHIIYVGRGGDDLMRRAGEGAAQLVVTDAAASSNRGMIHFVITAGRVRFHIDQRSAVRAGLVISSRLLNLALSVQRP